MHTIEVEQMLSKLSVSRPIFHCEADFQHTLAWEIHQQWQNSTMRLEFKPPHVGKRIYIDVWAVQNDIITAIELKYKTRKLQAHIGEETFELLDQSAQDVGRYDFAKDIERLEHTVFCHNDIAGYAIFLTNDSAYWKTPRNNSTVDASFRIHRGRVLTGKLSWGPNASKGTMRGREQAINIKGTYNLNWQEYSRPSQESYGKFRYLLVKIDCKGSV